MVDRPCMGGQGNMGMDKKRRPWGSLKGGPLKTMAARKKEKGDLRCI